MGDRMLPSLAARRDARPLNAVSGWFKNVALAISGRLDDHHDALREGGHIKFFSRRTLEALLTEAGFADIWFAGAGRLPLLWKSMVFAGARPLK